MRKIALEEHFTTKELDGYTSAMRIKNGVDALADIRRRLTHALRLVFGGTFQRFPKLQLILGHMGETLPHLLWRLDSRSRMYARLGRRAEAPLPSDIIRRNIAVTTTGVCSHASLTCAIEAVGEDNVMFSVDYPYESCDTAAAFIETAPLTDATRPKVCYGNAERMLHLAPAMPHARVSSTPIGAPPG